MAKKEVKGTHKTLHCSRCLRDFKADAEDLGPCVGPAGSAHDLHGNNDGAQPEVEE